MFIIFLLDICFLKGCWMFKVAHPSSIYASFSSNDLLYDIFSENLRFETIFSPKSW